MARGKTLGALITDLRAEIGHSTNAAVGQEKLAQLKLLLQRHQESLYDNYDWSFLRVRDADKTLSVGQRYYDFPATINPERVEKAFVTWGGDWVPVSFGIAPECEYNVHDSDADERSDPVEKWDWYNGGGSLQFEVWPIPATAGTIRFVGMRPLPAFVADADTAELDDRLIVLHAAAEYLADKKSGETKAGLARARLMQLRAQNSKSGPTVIGGAYDNRPRKHVTTIRIAGAG